MERFAFRCFSQPSTHGKFDTDAIRLDERGSGVRELPWLEDDRALDPRCHWGQRKCFFTELHFLSEMRRRGLMAAEVATVLYVGAGPGEHLPALIDMFPKVHWILYDKTPFHPEIKRARRTSVTVRARFFDDAELQSVRDEVRGEPLFFLCDMRLSEDDSSVENDMARQMEWGVRLGARAMMLKFRFPFGGPKGALSQDPLAKHNPLRSMLRTHAATRIPFGAWYLAGDLFGQLNAPPNSAESRLVVVCDEDGRYGVRQYDVGRYERMMQGYNYFRRNERYAVPEALAGAVRTVPGYDNGMESLMELTLLDEIRNIEGNNRESLTDYVVAFEKRLAGLTGKTLSACAIRGYDAGDYKRGPAKLRKKQLDFVRACVGQSLRRKLAFLSAGDADGGEDARRWCVREATERIGELRKAARGREQSGGGGWHNDPEMEARKILKQFTAEKYIGSAYGSSEVRERDHGTNIFINENIQISSRERMRGHMDNIDNIRAESVIPSESFNCIRLRVYRHGDDTITDSDVGRLVSRFQNYYGKIWKDAALNVNVKLGVEGDAPVDAAVPCYLRHRRHAPLSPEQCLKVVAEMRNAVIQLLSVRKTDTFSESENRKLTAASNVIITDDDDGGVGVVVKSLEQMEHYPSNYSEDRILALHTKSDPEMEKWPGWQDGRYIINPWPPIHDPQALSMSSWNLHINKATVSLFARRKDVAVPIRVQLPRDPDLLYRSFPNSMNKWTYIACIDIPISSPANGDSSPELFEFCKMVPDKKKSPVGYRLFVFKNGGNFGLVSFRSCAVDWGDVVERRGTVYDELCQIIYDVGNDDALQVFASMEQGSLSLIVGRKISIEVSDALPPEYLTNEIRATGWYDLYCNGSIGTNVRTAKFDGSLWVAVWLTWSDINDVYTGGARLAISLNEVFHKEMEPHSELSFNSYNTRLNTSVGGGGRRQSVDNNDAYGAALQRAFDAFETNRESIPDYKVYLNKMGLNLAPGDADLRAVHYKREGFKVLLDGKSRAPGDSDADVARSRVKKRFNNDSGHSADFYPVLDRISPPPKRVLVLAHNAYMSSFLLDDLPECSVDLLLHAPSIANNTGTVLAFEEHYGKRVRVRFGGVCVDSYSVDTIPSFGETRKYDLIVIDITARMTFAEPVAALLRYGLEKILVKRGSLMAWGEHPAPDDHVSSRLLDALASRFGDVEVQGKMYSWRTHKSDGSPRHVASHWFLGFHGDGGGSDKDRKGFPRVTDELVTALALGNDHAATGADELASELGAVKGTVQTAIVRHLDKVVDKLAALLKDYGGSGRTTGGDGNASTSALSWSAALLLAVVTVCASTVNAYR
jgi:hypothetical protein